jgi:GTPase SAR1 family protein
VKFETFYDKDFVCVVGDNGSGKTTLIQKFLLSKVPRSKIYVLNSSRQKNWYRWLPQDHITTPIMFTKKWFEVFLLEFASKHQGCVLVLDDMDNYKSKESDVLESVVINARHLGIGLIMSVRRLPSIPIEIYQMARYTFIARQLVNYNIYYIANLIPEQYVWQLKALPKFAFGVFSPDSEPIFAKIKLKL